MHHFLKTPFLNRRLTGLALLALVLVSGACSTTGSEPRVREGRLPESDAFGIVAGGGSYGEERTRIRVSRIAQAGTIVQSDSNNGTYMVQMQVALPESVEILLASNHDGVLLIRSRSSSQQLFAATALEGSFRLSDHVRIPALAEHDALIKKYTDAIAALNE
jgi:hypothetical protein